MAHSMSDVSFRKRVSNVEEKGGQNKFNKKKALRGHWRGTRSEIRLSFFNLDLLIAARSNVLP